MRLAAFCQLSAAKSNYERTHHDSNNCFHLDAGFLHLSLRKWAGLLRKPPAAADAGPGWVAVKMPTVKPPAGMPLMECGNRYSDGPFYHAKLTDGTAPLLWGRNLTPAVSTQDVRLVFDLIKGSVKACARYSASFGVGSLECERKTYTVEGAKPIRVVVAVEEKGQRQPGAPVTLVIEAASDAVIVGQVSTTQQID